MLLGTMDVNDSGNVHPSMQRRHTDAGYGPSTDRPPSSQSSISPKKRKRSRKSDSGKKFECQHEGCGKSYSRAEHLYRHQLNRRLAAVLPSVVCWFVDADGLLTMAYYQQMLRRKSTTAASPTAIARLSARTCVFDTESGIPRMDPSCKNATASLIPQQHHHQHPKASPRTRSMMRPRLPLLRMSDLQSLWLGHSRLCSHQPVHRQIPQ